MAVFAVMIAVWCAAGSWMGSHKRVITLVERHEHWIVPSVFILIGALILLKSEVMGAPLAHAVGRIHS